MRHSNLFIAFVALIATALLVFYGVAVLAPTEEPQQAQNAQRLTPLVRPKVDFGNPRRGAEDPAVIIVEFGDFECEPCAQMEADLKMIMEEFPTKVAVVWKDLPNTSIHVSAEEAASAARCAELQGAYWAYHDILLANQDSLSPENYPVFAAEVGIDPASLVSCMEAESQAPLIARDVEEAVRLQISSTPTLFIGDRRIEGAVGYDRLRSLVESAIAEAERPSAPAVPAP